MLSNVHFVNSSSPEAKLTCPNHLLSLNTELLKLKQELDDSTLRHETNLASVRQKHNAIIADLGDQIDSLNKGKAKMEQHKNSLLMDLNQSRHTLEELNSEKSMLEKNNKMMQNELLESSNRLEDIYQNLNDGDIAKKRLGTEREDLEKQIAEGEKAMKHLSLMKTSLANQLEDMKQLAEAETRDKASLVAKFKVGQVQVLFIFSLMDNNSNISISSKMGLSQVLQ